MGETGGGLGGRVLGLGLQVELLGQRGFDARRTRGASSPGSPREGRGIGDREDVGRSPSHRGGVQIRLREPVNVRGNECPVRNIFTRIERWNVQLALQRVPARSTPYFVQRLDPVGSSVYGPLHGQEPCLATARTTTCHVSEAPLAERAPAALHAG